MNYLKDREIWLSNVPTDNPPTGFFWKFIQDGKVVVRDSSGNNQIMVATSGSQAITGSLTVTEGITGTVSSASYVEYSNVANKPALVSGSSQITYSGLTGIPSGIVSGSAQITDFGIFATTGSNGFNGNQSITGSLTVTGQVVAQTLNVQQVTSSIVYSSGSNIFGNTIGNVQSFTGSLQVSGSSHYLLGSVGVGVTSPVAELQVGKSSDVTIAMSNSSSVTSGNRGSIVWYNSSVSSVATIRAAAVTDNVGTELQFFTRPAAGSLTQALTLASTGAATFTGNLAINNTLSSPGNLIETAGLNVYLRPASGYKVFIDTGDGLSTNALDITGDVRFRGSIYDQFNFVASGNYSNGTYYNIVQASQIGTGIYIFDGEVDTYGAGGEIYFTRFASVPFYFWEVGSNSTSFVDLPPVLGTGHHLGNPFPLFRLQMTLGGAGIFLQFNPNATWSGMDNSGGKAFRVNLKRIS